MVLWKLVWSLLLLFYYCCFMNMKDKCVVSRIPQYVYTSWALWLLLFVYITFFLSVSLFLSLILSLYSVAPFCKAADTQTHSHTNAVDELHITMQTDTQLQYIQTHTNKHTARVTKKTKYNPKLSKPM